MFGFLIVMMMLCASPIQAQPKKSAAEIEAKAKRMIHDKDVVWDAFEHIAFGAEEEFIRNDEERRKLNKIKKWKEPITVFVAGEDEDIQKFTPLVQNLVKQIQQHIDHPIRMYDPKIDPGARLWVFFVDDFEKAIFHTFRKDLEYLYQRIAKDKDYIERNYMKRIKTQPYLKAFFSSLNGFDEEPWFVVVFIHNQEKEAQIAVQEELVQSLGLINDYDALDCSIFADYNGVDFLTSLDWFLLKILYHPQIKSGMTRKEAKAVFDEVYEDVLKEENVHVAVNG